MPWVKVPRVSWQRTSPAVITLEYMPGIKISDRALLKQSGAASSARKRERLRSAHLKVAPGPETRLPLTEDAVQLSTQLYHSSAVPALSCTPHLQHLSMATLLELEWPEQTPSI